MKLIYTYYTHIPSAQSDIQSLYIYIYIYIYICNNKRNNANNIPICSHHNGFVAIYLLGHMMHGNILLAPMHQRVLNRPSKKRNISGHKYYNIYNIYTNIYNIYIYIHIYI